MRRNPRVTTVGLSVASLLALGLTFSESTASAAGTLPAHVDEVVTASLSNCPSGLSGFSGPVYADLASAVLAATSGQTIYVCLGTYDMSNTSAYGSNEQVDITKSLTIDGYNWDVAPSGADTPASVDPTSQSVFENGAGFLVQSSRVTISGLTFYENNFQAANVTDCSSLPCADSIDVQSLISGAGDQGESNVTISDNLFVNTGGAGSNQNGVVHFGLGQDASISEPTSDVSFLDTNDFVQDNVFTYLQGFENNALQMSDTSGAIVTGNTVTYPTNNGSGSDDVALSALWFPGFDDETMVSHNSLNGGGIDNDSGATPNTADPKSGIKFIDEDGNGNYGDGCGGQTISGNTISGFVFGISLIANDYDADANALCSDGPVNFNVAGNSISNSRLYGIYTTADATNGTISENVAMNTDAEGYTTDSYSAGEYDYYDAAGNATGNAWNNNTGNGTSFPSSIETTPPTTTTTTSSGPPPTVTTTTTLPTTTLPTTTTTVAPRPSVTIVGAALRSDSRVVTTVRCANAHCGGTVQLTKTVTTRVEIGNSKKYRLVTTKVIIGRASYSLAVGSQAPLLIQLNATGIKLLRKNGSRAFTCELTVTSAAGAKHKMVSLHLP
jgi:hypothetical protein